MSALAEFRPWFEKYPELFQRQTDILESSGFSQNYEILAKEGRLQFTGNSKADPGRKLIIELPAAFPSSAPKIFDTGPSPLLVRHHRTDNRQFCLFGFNENRWSATRTVGDAIDEVEELIAKFKEGSSDSASEPPEPLTSSLKYNPEGAFIVPPPISTFYAFDQLKFATGKFHGKFIYEGDSKKTTIGRGLVLDAEFGDKKLKSDRPFSDFFGKNGSDMSGDWFYEPAQIKPQQFSEILQKFFQRAKSVKKSDFYWIALIFREEIGKVGQTELTWVFARANSAGEMHLIRTYPYKQQQRYVRIPGLEGLEQKRVTVIGCGSIGSKIAANLAASGVNGFNLIDNDFFEPNNAVRHELGVDLFGIGKAKGLSNRLCSLNPAIFANSQYYHFQVAGANNLDSEKAFQKMVQNSDLIIDATATHSASHYINELAFGLGIPCIYASVTNGAWAGEVIRVIPGKTPCWLCWLDQYFDVKPPSAPESKSEVFAQGCDQPTFTGTTYELGMVANLATSMAVDTLLNGSEFPQNYLRWSGRDQTGRLAFLTEFFETKHQGKCGLCGPQHGI